jgi:F0F1-type ATP synthase membrane subunit b/b'
MLAEKIIGRSLNPDDHKKLVNDFIEEVGELH